MIFSSHMVLDLPLFQFNAARFSKGPLCMRFCVFCSPDPPSQELQVCNLLQNVPTERSSLPLGLFTPELSLSLAFWELLPGLLVSVADSSFSLGMSPRPEQEAPLFCLARY